ncbi:MAG: hypothetical protein K6G47_03355 [Clostridia bacterium]|nr:hypothetical protein [Clostridia bacterium]
MKLCRKLLKKNTRPLSSLRDIVELVLISNTMSIIRAQQISKMISFISFAAPSVLSAFLKTDDDKN